MNALKKIIPTNIKEKIKKSRVLYWKLYFNNLEPGFSRKALNQLSEFHYFVGYNKYGGYCVPSSSSYRPAAQKILYGDVYEPETIKFIISNYAGGDIIHAGTYFGDFLPPLSKTCSKNSIIWAFEPNSDNYRCAEATLKMNNLKNVKLKNAGLGSKKETLLLKTVDKNGQALGGSSQIFKENPDSNFMMENIQVVTIDETVDKDRNISIIQLDVEGHEKDALCGALTTIKKQKPMLILEAWEDNKLISSDWFEKNILGIGYMKFKKIHGNIVYKFTG